MFSQAPLSPGSTSIRAPPRPYCSMATLQVMKLGSLSGNEAELYQKEYQNVEAPSKVESYPPMSDDTEEQLEMQIKIQVT
ncbi:unnamed protein product [Thlaspi arvense]|uniref:Uncharacterized protein n=1 Tax=Thlaspi arvense TaxID=13288 RepID=A0AAU9SR77_THLAR|nr:unnamed protein product [Thlaspi arvense]